MEIFVLLDIYETNASSLCFMIHASDPYKTYCIILIMYDVILIRQKEANVKNRLLSLK